MFLLGAKMFHLCILYWIPCLVFMSVTSLVFLLYSVILVCLDLLVVGGKKKCNGTGDFDGGVSRR